MKVRMTKTAAGPGGVLMSGKVYDIPEQEAKSLVAAKAAIFLKKPMFFSDPPVAMEPEPAQEEEQGQAKEETASIEPEQKAVKPKGEPKKGKQKDVKK